MPQSLVVAEYLLHSGSPKVAQYFRENIYVIKTLNEFQHIDDSGRDVGQDVRIRAREFTRLLTDDNKLAETRRRRKQMHDRMAGRPVTENDDEEQEKRKAPPRKQPSQEERDIQRALKLSEQEEAERRRRLKEQSKDGSLFDDPKAR